MMIEQQLAEARRAVESETLHKIESPRRSVWVHLMFAAWIAACVIWLIGLALAGGTPRDATATATATEDSGKRPCWATNAGCVSEEKLNISEADLKAYSNAGKEPETVKFRWKKGGFGSVMIIHDIRVKEPQDLPHR